MYNVIVRASHTHFGLVIGILNIVTELEYHGTHAHYTISGLWRNNSIALILNSTQLVYFIADNRSCSEIA